MKMMSSVFPDAPSSEAPVLRTNPRVTTVVIEIDAPATKAAELRRQFLVVARKIAVSSCGPAIITNASGMIFARVTLEHLLRPSFYLRRRGATDLRLRSA